MLRSSVNASARLAGRRKAAVAVAPKRGLSQGHEGVSARAIARRRCRRHRVACPVPTCACVARAGHDNVPTQPKNVGAPPKAVADDAEQLTGRVFAELQFERETGLDMFDRAPLFGAFGTMENPVMVPSTMETRVVGCLGARGGARR